MYHRDRNLWIDKVNVKLGNAIAGLILCFLLVGIGGFLWTNYRINENNKKQCEVINLISSPGPDVPSPTPGTRTDKIVKGFKKLGESYKCR